MYNSCPHKEVEMNMYEMSGSTSVELCSMNKTCAGYTVLLVDGDSTCLAIISKMLCQFGYRVMTAKRASDALCIIRDREHEIDLVLSEGCLPDMDKYELLETIKEMSKLPIIVMSADYDEKDMLGGLFKGAMLYLVKPITMDDLKNLWQFAFIKERKRMAGADQEINRMEKELFLENATQQRPIHKRLYEIENDEEDYNDIPVLKKPKMIWTKKLHNRFLQAVRIIGIEGAHPKKIHEFMNVPGLRKEHVSSHLQKYRLSLKRQQRANQKTNNTDSTFVNYAIHHPLSPVSSKEGSLQFWNPRSMAVAEQQPVNNGLIQENLNGGSMHIPSLCSSYIPMHDESTTEIAQQTPAADPSCNLIEPATNGLEGLHQTGSSEQFPNGATDLFNIGDSELENLLNCPMLFDGCSEEQQEAVQPETLQLPPPPPPPPPQPSQGTEIGGEFDGGFAMGKETTQAFYDWDFDVLW